MIEKEDSGKRLIDAINSGKTEEAKSLLRQGNTKSVEGIDLCYCALRGNSELVVYLIDELERDVHIFDDMALCYACRNGHTEVIKALLERGANVSVGKNKPLRWALIYGHEHIVDILLEAGADPALVDGSVLSVACDRGYFEIVKILVERFSVDVNERHSIRYALLSQNTKIFEYLLKVPGLDIHFDKDWAVKTCAKKGWFYEMKAIMAIADISAVANELLKISVRHKQLKCMRYLIEEKDADTQCLIDIDFKTYNPKEALDTKIMQYLGGLTTDLVHSGGASEGGGPAPENQGPVFLPWGKQIAMNQFQHEKACEKKFGRPFPEVHAFLDQYYRKFPGNNHRQLLHHQRGIELVVEKFGEDARGPAVQHVELDWGFVPESWEGLEQYYFPLSVEEQTAMEAELQKLYPDLFDIEGA